MKEKVTIFKKCDSIFIQFLGEWNPSIHKKCSKRIQQEIKTILLLSLVNPNIKTPYHQQSFFYLLPKEIMIEIFQFIATP